MNVYEDGNYLSENPGLHAEDSEWKAGKIREILKNNKISPKNICEIGSGSGLILKHLSEYFRDSEFTGYDISPHAIEICKKITKKNVSFRLGDLAESDIDGYDLLLIIDVLEHVEDYIGFLTKIKPKANYKLFHIPLDISVQMVLRSKPIMKVRKKCGHIHYFTKETAIESLKDAGYSIVDWQYTSVAMDLPAKNWKPAVLKIPRKILFRLNRDLTCRILGGYSLLVLAK